MAAVATTPRWLRFMRPSMPERPAVCECGATSGGTTFRAFGKPRQASHVLDGPHPCAHFVFTPASCCHSTDWAAAMAPELRGTTQARSESVDSAILGIGDFVAIVGE